MLDRRLQVAEYLFIAGSVVGSIASGASGQILYAVVPVTVALLLGALNRVYVEQRMRRRLNNAITQLHRQLSDENRSSYEELKAAIASLQAQFPRYFTQTESSDPQATPDDRTELNAQLASFEQSLNSIVQYLNSSSLLTRVEQLERAIASSSTQKAQSQQQPSDIGNSRIDEIERRLQAIEHLAAQPISDRVVNEPQRVPPTPEPESVAPKAASSPLPTWSHLYDLTGHSDWISALAISPDGQTLVSASFDATVKVWQLSTGKLIHTLSDHSQGVLTVAISRGGRILASGGFDETIKLWNLDAGELMYTLTGHTGSVRTLAIANDNQTLISGSFDRTIKLWRLDTGEFLGNLTKNAGQVAAIALTSDNRIATGGADGLIALWVLDTARADTQTSPSRILTGNLSSVCSLAISPDGKILAAGCTDGTVKLWQLDTLALLNGFQGHSGQVMSVVFSVDGQTLISGSADGTIKLWDLKAARQVGILLDDEADSVQAVAISPNSQLIAGGGAGSMVKIWQRD